MIAGVALLERRPLSHQLEETDMWWHAYGHVVPTGQKFQYEGKWVLAVVERSDRAPDRLVRELKLGESDLPYLCSWDHEPSDADKRFITPAEHRFTRTAPETGPEVDW